MNAMNSMNEAVNSTAMNESNWMHNEVDSWSGLASKKRQANFIHELWALTD